MRQSTLAMSDHTPPEITEYLCERTIHDLLIERVTVLHGSNRKKHSSAGELLLDIAAQSCRTGNIR